MFKGYTQVFDFQLYFCKHCSVTSTYLLSYIRFRASDRVGGPQGQLVSSLEEMKNYFFMNKSTQRVSNSRCIYEKLLKLLSFQNNKIIFYVFSKVFSQEEVPLLISLQTYFSLVNNKDILAVCIMFAQMVPLLTTLVTIVTGYVRFS